MTLLQLQAFIAVCQERSFTRAGEVLNMTQSAISQAVSNLESELRVNLLIRDRGRIHLTQIGERVLSHAREMIQHSLEMQQEAEAAAGIENGTIRIGVTPGVSRFLPKLLFSFRFRHPDINFELLEGVEHEVKSWLASRRIDIGFMVIDLNNTNAVPLYSDHFKLYIPLSHAYAHCKALSLHEIKDECHIQVTTDITQVIHHEFKQQGLRYSAKYEISDICTVLEMVKQRFGVAVLPDSILPDTIPDIVGIPIEPAITRYIGYAVQDMNRITPTCAEFILDAKANMDCGYECEIVF